MKIKKLYKSITCLTAFLISLAALSEAQVMSDYTAYPPSVTSNTTPNLMLMIDNSASMYDLAYIDVGGGVCSVTTGTSCLSDDQCPDGETCDKSTAAARESAYCYDNTYISTKTYVGYFDQKTIYKYITGSSRFEPIPNIVGPCSHQISDELCVTIVSGSPSTVTEFTAKGNYLNWLISSKFDVQKQILTGGKYDTGSQEFISESRGCVGRGFIKEALTADYVEGGTNTSLGIAFSISGPENEYNRNGVSNGGQTSIEIYEGDYNEALCQEAINQINYASNPSAIRSAVEDCLSYDPHAAPGSQYCLLDPSTSCSVDSDCDNIGIAGECSSGNPSSRTCLSGRTGESCVKDADCDTIASTVGPCVGGTTHSAEVTSKIVFNQAMQECWQIWSGSTTEVGNDAWSGEAPKCTTLYSDYKVCNGGSNDGNTCTSAIDCPDGGICEGGPTAIGSDNPAFMCNSTYTGYCATTSDNWATTDWVAKEFDDPQDCFLSKYLEFCNGVKVPPVIDPSDTPDDTSETANIPAMIADIGVEAQLGSSIGPFRANNYRATAPTGLIDKYADEIRFGAMGFNFDGSEYECNLSPTDSLDCAKVCSSTTSLSCNTDADCPGTETCTDAVSKDAGYIIHYIGDPIGDHDSGLIYKIDESRANTWTPFAETFYNSIAYYVTNAEANFTDPLIAAKFDADADAIEDPIDDNYSGNKNPIEFYCQNNNILIISDGGPTTDRDSEMRSKVNHFSNLFDDGDAVDSDTCGSYSGSTYLDDLSYYAKHRNIFSPSDSDPDDDEAAQRITTYVVYTGSEESTETGECAPKTLMENTALNGGTELYYSKNPGELREKLELAFLQISSDIASGSSASVLSSSTTGEGAVYHAQYYPKKRENLEYRSWLGVVQSLFIDSYGNLREDEAPGNAILESSDPIIKMQHTTEEGTRIARCKDTTGDGKGDSCSQYIYTYDDINPVWSGEKLLWQRDPDTRTIFTTIDGYTREEFVAANNVALKPYLREDDDTIAAKVINWIRGIDYSLPADIDASHPAGYRKRDITLTDINGVSKTNVWKLGDIVHSAPTLVGRPMENFDLLYGDASYSKFWLEHKNRLRVTYIGANDGMLHAFNAGCFDANARRFYSDVNGSGVCFDGTHTLGEELWAFIPGGLLPHLQWLTDPDYTHVYYVDSKPKVSDVKIFDDDATNVGGWGTILIGGYRLGGNDIDWTHNGTDYSASPEYFALDITDPLNPRLLWTFSNPDLGLTMSYPSIAKIGTDWYAIFGSGATEFDQESNLTSYQNGNIFILKISGGTDGVISTWTENSNFWKRSTGGVNTFLANSMVIDVDLSYDIDVMYIGENDPLNDNAYLRRLTTLKGAQTDPLSWEISTLADISTIGGAKDAARRITAAPAAAMDGKANLWVYFGTGQFIGLDDRNTDDTGAFYGIKDGGWKGDNPVEFSTLLDISKAEVKQDGTVSGVIGACGGAISKWSNLLSGSDNCDGWAMYFGERAESTDYTGTALKFKGEKMFTKPFILGGLVTWTTFIPGIDECTKDGESNVYAVYFETGTAFKQKVFTDQTSTDPVARVKNIGTGMASTVSGQETKDGKTKGIIKQSNGTIIEIENVAPVSRKSKIMGWSQKPIK